MEDSCFRLAGEAYAHEIIHGKAIKELKEGTFVERDFMLC
jgi:hypothetical protein